MRLFMLRGDLPYGERVSQREHAQQCAELALAAGASDALITAALLHDVGHLLSTTAVDERKVDDRHEHVGAKFLARWFVDDVTRPIALHVEAKRYLCLVEPSYRQQLSPASIDSLALQGGVMNASEARAFQGLAGAEEAVLLRRWDEAAKQVGRASAAWVSFVKHATRCLR